MREIIYPRKISEAEVQAQLWTELKKFSVDARLQVIGKGDDKLCKLDLVVFQNAIPKCIVECKGWSKRYSKERWYQLAKNTKQVVRYQQFGVPVFVCGRQESIPNVICLIRNCLR